MKLLLGGLAILALASGCRKKEAQAQAEPVVAAPATEAPARRPIIYLHGMCSDPREDLDAWGDVAEKYGTVIPVMGDVPCADKPGQLKWSMDAGAIDRKIDDALEAREEKLDTSALIVVGESMGAARAEMLAKHFPAKYARLVLIGSPQAPSPRSLKGAKAVANLAGEKEPQDAMREGTRALDRAGTPSRFWELPDATHGNYGPDGDRIMNEAFGFVTSH